MIPYARLHLKNVHYFSVFSYAINTFSVHCLNKMEVVFLPFQVPLEINDFLLIWKTVANPGNVERFV